MRYRVAASWGTQPHDPLAVRAPVVTSDPTCPRCGACLLPPGHARLERVHVAMRCSVVAFEVRCVACGARWVLAMRSEGFEQLPNVVARPWREEL